jgi:enoyl-CoA hydratase/carnithine racemase
VTRSCARPVQIITLDRPSRRNAVDATTARELAGSVRDFEAGDARTAVLTGAGGTFCAGNDLAARTSLQAQSALPESEALRNETTLALAALA